MGERSPVAARAEDKKMHLFGWLRRRQRKSPSERLPWYRAPDYSGDLIEAEKRELERSACRLVIPPTNTATSPNMWNPTSLASKSKRTTSGRSESLRASSQLPWSEQPSSMSPILGSARPTRSGATFLGS